MRIKIIPQDQRITDNRLHLNEATRLIAIRAKQISGDCNIFVDASGLEYPDKIAKLELKMRRMPLKLQRRVAILEDNIILVEEWDPNLMTLPTELNYHN